MRVQVGLCVGSEFPGGVLSIHMPQEFPGGLEIKGSHVVTDVVQATAVAQVQSLTKETPRAMGMA